MKFNLKLFDIHDCLHHPFSRKRYAGEPHKDWLIQENSILFDGIRQEIQAKKYGKVVLAYFTNAQDYYSDRANYHKGGSITRTLPLVQEHLVKTTGEDVLLETFLMSDIYGKSKTYEGRERSLDERRMAAGANFKAIVAGREQVDSILDPQAPEGAHARWMFDQDKVSLLYTHVHRFAYIIKHFRGSLGVAPLQKDEEDEIVIDIKDDNNGIRGVLANFFKEAPYLLPKNVKINIIKYKGGQPELETTLQGTGELDEHYDWTARLMSAKSYFFGSGANEGYRIKSADELRSYHEADHYRNPNRKMEMSAARVDPQEILRLRNQQIKPFLESDPNILAPAYVSLLRPPQLVAARASTVSAASRANPVFLPEPEVKTEQGPEIKQQPLPREPQVREVKLAPIPESQTKMPSQDELIIAKAIQSIHQYLQEEKYPKAKTKNPSVAGAYFCQSFDKGYNRAMGYLALLQGPGLSDQYKLLVIETLMRELNSKKLSGRVRAALQEMQVLGSMGRSNRRLFPVTNERRAQMQNIIMAVNEKGSSKRYHGQYVLDFFKNFHVKMFKNDAFQYIKTNQATKLEALIIRPKAFFFSKAIGREEGQALQKCIAFLKNDSPSEVHHLTQRELYVLENASFGKKIKPMLWMLEESLAVGVREEDRRTRINTVLLS